MSAERIGGAGSRVAMTKDMKRPVDSLQQIARPLQMWTVVTRSGYMIAPKRTRREAVKDTVEASTLTWAKWKRKWGLRLARVEVREVERPTDPSSEIAGEGRGRGE